MDKRSELKKNKLDLEYQRQLQTANAVLLFGTTGLLSFMGTFIWKTELLLQGSLISIFTILISLIAYRKIQSTLEKILDEISNLS